MCKSCHYSVGILVGGEHRPVHKSRGAEKLRKICTKIHSVEKSTLEIQQELKSTFEKMG